MEALVRRIEGNKPHSTLLGVTGSGKTFTMAHVVAQVNRPTLVISHNKTLAAQLFGEFKEFFPQNAVNYFVSYYDYYQPEAYIPQRDIYIEKDAAINEDIDRLRLAATSALMARRDVLVVASVSCIYGLGSPQDYRDMMIPLKIGDEVDFHRLARRLVDLQYERADDGMQRGKFRVLGDVALIHPPYEEAALKVEYFGETIEKMAWVHPVSGEPLHPLEDVVLYPAKHFVLPDEKIDPALARIERELEERVKVLEGEGKLLEAQRIQARTRYDMELLREVGYCQGIENYSRHLAGRREGERSPCLLDYFPDDFLCIVDESHVTLTQIRGMYNGDRARKQTLVDHGFRLPSAMDNRPMTFDEWEAKVPQVVCVSATPGPLEVKRSKGEVVEQVIRPTGLVDPAIRVEPAKKQVPHLRGEIARRVERGERTLVTTLTKRLAEDLTAYLEEQQIKCRYLHSDIETIDRSRLLRELREGKYDVLVGVNLLREGLDLPEVTLVAILDADKEGFLRSATSIIQTVGRTARNVNGEVILYADRMTDSMQQAINETERRRKIQLDFNEKNDITPQTIAKGIREGIEGLIKSRKVVAQAVRMKEKDFDRSEMIRDLEKEMHEAAEKLEFERAAELRDVIREMMQQQGDGPREGAVSAQPKKRRKRKLKRGKDPLKLKYRGRRRKQR